MNLPVPTKSWYREHWKWLRLLGYSPLLWGPAYLLFTIAWGGLVGGPLIGARLSEELSRVSPPAQSQLVEHTTLNKYSYVKLGEEYSTSLTLQELRDHYDAELERNGWRLLEEHEFSVYVSEAIYCKGDYTASLDYLGNHGDDPQNTYRLYVSSQSDCMLMKGGFWRVLPFDSWAFLLMASLSWVFFGLLAYHATNILSEEELAELGLWFDPWAFLLYFFFTLTG